MADWYVTQSGAGGQDGTSLDDAWAASDFNDSGNWGIGGIVAGDIVRLSGTITTALTVQGSGSAGSPIRILFDSGAKLSSSAWADTGALIASSKDYITIDGGVNGIIENTDNGTALGTQQATTGIKMSTCISFIVRNLTIQNLYVRTANSDDSNAYGICIDTSIPNNLLIENCILNHAKTGIWVRYSPAVTNRDVLICYNYLDNLGDGIVVGNTSEEATLTNITITRNTYNMNDTWDGNWTPPPGDGHHHMDGIQMFAQDTSPGDTYIDGHIEISMNKFGGAMGGNITSPIFVDDPYIDGGWCYGNLLYSTDGSPTNGFITIAGDEWEIHNNTIIGNNGGIGIAVGGGVVYSTNCRVYNNLIYDVNTGMFLGDANQDFSFCDYNQFFSIIQHYKGAIYSHAQWLSLLGWDLHSLVVDPAVSPVDDYVPHDATGRRIGVVGVGFQRRWGDTVGMDGWDIGAHHEGNPAIKAVGPIGLYARPL